ncbi:hypothetical protein FGG08_005142 [Glutinoglossum americanum]|uniref:Uncharacterized protein n=1 Tax=Glutinoglossum americanum TaxID=1670608 RepID=A0A9P8HZ22_9PEZI|nr:hypothetical protein FGG08_005142 [Glutinoglossum americanum]
MFNRVCREVWKRLGQKYVDPDEAQGIDGNEGEIGFGQLVQLPLIGLPVLAAIEAYHSRDGNDSHPPALPSASRLPQLERRVETSLDMRRWSAPGDLRTSCQGHSLPQVIIPPSDAPSDTQTDEIPGFTRGVVVKAPGQPIQLEHLIAQRRRRRTLPTRKVDREDVATAHPTIPPTNSSPPSHPPAAPTAEVDKLRIRDRTPTKPTYEPPAPQSSPGHINTSGGQLRVHNRALTNLTYESSAPFSNWRLRTHNCTPTNPPPPTRRPTTSPSGVGGSEPTTTHPPAPPPDPTLLAHHPTILAPQVVNPYPTTTPTLHPQPTSTHTSTHFLETPSSFSSPHHLPS